MENNTASAKPLATNPCSVEYYMRHTRKHLLKSLEVLHKIDPNVFPEGTMASVVHAFAQAESALGFLESVAPTVKGRTPKGSITPISDEGGTLTGCVSDDDGDALGYFEEKYGDE